MLELMRGEAVSSLHDLAARIGCDYSMVLRIMRQLDRDGLVHQLAEKGPNGTLLFGRGPPAKPAPTAFDPDQPFRYPTRARTGYRWFT